VLDQVVPRIGVEFDRGVRIGFQALDFAVENLGRLGFLSSGKSSTLNLFFEIGDVGKARADEDQRDRSTAHRPGQLAQAADKLGFWRAVVEQVRIKSQSTNRPESTSCSMYSITESASSRFGIVRGSEPTPGPATSRRPARPGPYVEAFRAMTLVLRKGAHEAKKPLLFIGLDGDQAVPGADVLVEAHDERSVSGRVGLGVVVIDALLPELDGATHVTVVPSQLQSAVAHSELERSHAARLEGGASIL